MVLGGAALFWRLRYPVAVTVAAMVFGTILPWPGGHFAIMDVATTVALYTVASQANRRTSWSLAAVALALMSANVVLLAHGTVFQFSSLLPVNYVVVAVALGEAVKSRRTLLEQAHERARQAELTREQEASNRVQQERLRIARDLHDVVAHHIALVNAQAGVAHHLMAAHPDRAVQALATIRETSRAALDELRATVGLLRRDDDPAGELRPAPQLGDLDDLVATFGAANLDVVLTRRGPAFALSSVTELAAYRIIQEALTNAAKHATEPRADVGLDFDGDRLRVTVRSPGRPGHHGPGAGNGLIGMRERAASVGRRLESGFQPDGLFVTSAVLPVRWTDH